MKEFKTVKVKITEKQEHFNDTEVNQGISKRDAGTIHEFQLTKAIQKGIDLGWFEVIEEPQLPGADELDGLIDHSLAKKFADDVVDSAVTEIINKNKKVDETENPNEIESVKVDPPKLTETPNVDTSKNQPTNNRVNKGNKK